METSSRGPIASIHADVYVGLSLLVFCGAAWWATTTFREVPAMLSQNVPPTFFPRLVLVVIAALSLLLVLRGLRRRREPGEPIPRTVPVTAGLLVLAVALVPRLGMLSTVFLFSIALPLYWGERRFARIGALAVLLPLALHGLFVLALGMRFPRGLLW